jgi:hypothetical protein
MDSVHMAKKIGINTWGPKPLPKLSGNKDTPTSGLVSWKLNKLFLRLGTFLNMCAAEILRGYLAGEN